MEELISEWGLITDLAVICSDADAIERELSRKVKLSIFQSIYIPILTYNDESWVVTERMNEKPSSQNDFFPPQGGWAQPRR